MDVCYTSAAHNLHTEAPPSDIVAAMEQLKRQRNAVEDKRMQLAQALAMDDGSVTKAEKQPPTSEFARLFQNNVVPTPLA
ncbi:hypothetical protein H310_09580 [Aphanomyces invadans]|uniref:Uncharacterized protein n=1 Tax=Aphanomyces invadans TaxID=157072 RepID=A0A024TU47_9STRA|nr:hypothetical protein H310_09580 [Aphanomyces invadans]ETV97695.1 hypothetical protein H310_09580 [Aphanomyces invadans]|eukprot:XP_008873904.1 hypothetical protein H310_09580 [Aphanomyces invadans]